MGKALVNAVLQRYNRNTYISWSCVMKIGKILYWLLIIILVICLIVSGTHVVRYVIDSAAQKEEYDELAALVEQSRSETLPPPTVDDDSDATQPVSTDPTEPTEPVILQEYQALYEKNPDTVGWMKIDGTPINYPVMQTPDRVDYYLKRNFNRVRSEYGCLYARETCDVFSPSDNVTIYGHHMNDGTMFAGLDNFVSQSFWEEYHTINFDTLYEHHTYTIFAVLTTTATQGKGFSYHLFENAEDEADFDQFIATCKELSLYDTGITPEYGDKVICLSTCEYTQINGRLVVVAVRDSQNNGVA